MVEIRSVYNHYLSVATRGVKVPFGKVGTKTVKPIQALTSIPDTVKSEVGADRAGSSKEPSMQQLQMGVDGDRLIALASPRVSISEAEELLEILKAVLEHGTHSDKGPDILLLMNSKAYSNAFKSLAMYVNRIFGLMRQNASPAGRARLVRSLLHLREKLIACLPAHDYLPSVPVSAGNEPGHDLNDAIKNTYQRTLGRVPDKVETEMWVTHIEGGLPFQEFVLRVENSEEARAHTRAAAELTEFARRLDPIVPPPASRDRYTMVQKALRKAARCRKYSSIAGVHA
jgi:hypothetical protein